MLSQFSYDFQLEELRLAENPHLSYIHPDVSLHLISFDFISQFALNHNIIENLGKTEQIVQLFPLTYEITFAQSIWYQDLSSLKITQITYTWHRIIFQICYKVVIKGFWLIFKILKVSPKLGMATIPTWSPRLPALWERPSLYSKVAKKPFLKCSSHGKSQNPVDIWGGVKWRAILSAKAVSISVHYSSMLLNYSTWQQIEDLDLRGNHWQCDCHNLWLLNTLVPSTEVLG